MALYFNSFPRVYVYTFTTLHLCKFKRTYPLTFTYFSVTKASSISSNIPLTRFSIFFSHAVFLSQKFDDILYGYFLAHDNIINKGYFI